MDAVTERPLYRVVAEDGALPIKVWAADVEEGALQQARNLARLPIALRHVALMPDAHQGYGMPIGGVLLADKAVVPYAVGVDIGCGVALIELDLDSRQLTEQARVTRRDVVRDLLDAVAARVPVGNGPQAEHRPGAPTRAFDPDPELDHPDYLHEVLDYAARQLGTLGGGNHFLELQRDADGHLFVMLHSGSRSVGKKVCDRHVRVAKDLHAKFRTSLPDPDLAWLPWDTDEGRAYWNDMQVALSWAEQNRAEMAERVVAAVHDVLGVAARQTLDVHHNYAAWENHSGKNGIVHRKGAVRARAGERVLIPGSMGTASYVGEGLGSRDSFESCQHGAGRIMSRAAARRAMAGVDLEADLGGVVLVTPDRGAVVDEAPRAYKDVDAVMDASRDLVAPVARLTPLGVLKG